MVALIQNPPFIVRIGPVNNNQEARRLLDQVNEVAIPQIIHYGKLLASSLYSGYSKALFLIPLYLRFSIAIDVATLNLRVIAFVAAYAITGAVISVYIFVGKVRVADSPVEVIIDENKLKSHADERINVEHMTTFDSAVNVGVIPEGVQVEALLDMFDEINFNHPNRAAYFGGFVDPETRWRIHVASRRTNLRNYIDHINNRAAYTGTPPAGTQALNTFYDSLENLARGCIYKVQKEYREFLDARGCIVPQKPQDLLPNEVADEEYKLAVKEYKEYEMLLQQKGRLAIELSIAGSACGARWLSETVNMYNALYGNEVNGSFKDAMAQVLGTTRSNIANYKIAQMNNNAHTYSGYMQALGKLLGIPGTQNIIEQLEPFSEYEANERLKSFFEDYNSDRMLDDIKKAYKDVEGFKEKMFDWIKEQAGEWKKSEYALQLNPLIQNLENLSKEEVITDAEDCAKVDLFIEFLKELTPDEKANIRSLRELLPNGALSKESKQFLTSKFAITRPGVNPIIARDEWRRVFLALDENHEKILLSQIKLILDGDKNREALLIGEIKKCLEDDKKLRKINKELLENGISDFSIKDFTQLENKEVLKENLKNALERKRSIEFFSEIMPKQEIAQEGEALEEKLPSDNVFYWALGSNGFLNY